MTNNSEYLVFDVETTGLPRNWKAPFTQLSNWPRIVQIGWFAYDRQETLVESQSHIIKPDGYIIPPSSTRVHGITNEFAKANGVEIESVLNRFAELVKSTGYVIAHNLAFDKQVVRSEFYRADISDYFSDVIEVCTMQASTGICKLPGKYGYKWPTLAELYRFLFNDSFEDSHDALNDAKVAADCYFELKRIYVV